MRFSSTDFTVETTDSISVYASLTAHQHYACVRSANASANRNRTLLFDQETVHRKSVLVAAIRCTHMVRVASAEVCMEIDFHFGYYSRLHRNSIISSILVFSFRIPEMRETGIAECEHARLLQRFK